MPCPQDECGNLIAHRMVCLLLLIEFSINKTTHPGGRAARNAKYLLGSPSTLEQAIHLPDHCAVLCPDRYRSVLGLDDKQINYRPVCYRALLLEGRKEPVTGLRRHPLIYPIF
mgnify:CR=1 FL=1